MRISRRFRGTIHSVSSDLWWLEEFIGDIVPLLMQWDDFCTTDSLNGWTVIRASCIIAKQ